jgi:hypothetical protein
MWKCRFALGWRTAICPGDPESWNSSPLDCDTTADGVPSVEPACADTAAAAHSSRAKSLRTFTSSSQLADFGAISIVLISGFYLTPLNPISNTLFSAVTLAHHVTAEHRLPFAAATRPDSFRTVLLWSDTPRTRFPALVVISFFRAPFRG